jgi:hypothetical protein
MTCTNAGLHSGKPPIADKDEAAGSSPARPTTPGLNCRNAHRWSPSMAIASVTRLRTAVLRTHPWTAALGRLRVERRAEVRVPNVIASAEAAGDGCQLTRRSRLGPTSSGAVPEVGSSTPCEAQRLGPLAPGYKMTGHHLVDPRGLRHRQQSGNRDLGHGQRDPGHGQHQRLDRPDWRPLDRVLPAGTSNLDRACECGRGET